MANPFTPEQISQILEEFFKVVGTRQYIGARYVPIFGRKNEESIEWDNSAPYEPLTIVLYQGNSYTSRQYVPVGVEITNQEFWALTGNYNAQVEQYRRDVQAFDGRISANATAIDAEKTRAEGAERANAQAIADEKTRAEGAERANAQAIADEVTRAKAAEKANADAAKSDISAVRADISTVMPFDSAPTNGSSKGISSSYLYNNHNLIRKVVIMGDSWAADSPGIGIGRAIYNNIRGEKQLIANIAVAGAIFGDSKYNWCFSDKNTGAQLAAARNTLTEEQRESVTDVIMVVGVNNISSEFTRYAPPSADVKAHCEEILNAFPNARGHWFFSHERGLTNSQMLNNLGARYYFPFIAGGRNGGFTVYPNSLVWLMDENESTYWDGDSFFARHPNSTGVAQYAKIAASVCMSGYDSEFISDVTSLITQTGDYWGDGSYHKAFIKNLQVHCYIQMVGNAPNLTKIMQMSYAIPPAYEYIASRALSNNKDTTVNYFRPMFGVPPFIEYHTNNGSNAYAAGMVVWDLI